MSKPQEHEEVGLNDLLDLIKKVLNKIGLIFLSFFNFLIRNAIILAILIAIGLGWGYYQNENRGSLYQTEMIVATNFDGSQYLYKALEEVNYKIKSRDKAFLGKMGLTKNAGKVRSLDIQPIFQIKQYSEEQTSYMELFEDTKILDDDQKKDAYRNNATRHKIILVHRLPLDSRKVLTGIINYIRNNAFYQGLYVGHHKDVNMMLNSNLYVMQQLDSLITNYAHSLTYKSNKSTDVGYFNSENDFDLGAVLESRQLIQQDITKLREEQAASTEFLKVIDEGSIAPYEEATFLDNYMIKYTLLLVLGYFALIIFIKVFKKARALK